MLFLLHILECGDLMRLLELPVFAVTLLLVVIGDIIVDVVGTSVHAVVPLSRNSATCTVFFLFRFSVMFPENAVSIFSCLITTSGERSCCFFAIFDPCGELLLDLFGVLGWLEVIGIVVVFMEVVDMS